MLLAVDSGNTRIKWSLITDGRMHRCGAAPKNKLTQIKNLLRRNPAASVWVSYVGDRADRRHLREVLKSHRCRWLTTPPATAASAVTATAAGLKNEYRPPQRLGVDRYLAAVAAAAMSRRGTIIVSAGSAVTVDALRAGGVFAGGIILPGLAAMRQSLHQRTHLPAVAATAKASGGGGDGTPPRTTRDGIATGTVLAVAGAVEQFRRRFFLRGGAAGVLLTGGDAAQLAAFLPGAKVVDDLVLRGIAVLATAQ